jgi:predicted house-cleaning NTP pyrophosphatase (Maf/HAM1 superfamily)
MRTGAWADGEEKVCSFAVTTDVEFKALPDEEIEAYIASG